MAICRSQEPGLLVIALIFVSGVDLGSFVSYLEDSLNSKVLECSPEWEFVSPNDYYYKEMGKPLFRRFYVFDRRIYPLDLVDIKLKAIQIESVYAVDGRRKINIDPGYLSSNKFLLSTTKNYYHRIYLDKGVYVELTLSYFCKRWNSLPWTYFDFEKYKDWFNRVRDCLPRQEVWDEK